MPQKKDKIVVGICGGIAIYKACELVRLLKSDGHEVVCLMTPEAAKLIQPVLFGYLSENRVYTDIFAAHQEYSPQHIRLAQWADKMVIIPATAHIIAKLRAGLCDDIVCLTALSTRAEILLCPAMHEEMYLKDVTSENIAALKKKGFNVTGPVRGALLNGRKAMGHLQDINKVLERLRRL